MSNEKHDEQQGDECLPSVVMGRVLVVAQCQFGGGGGAVLLVDETER